MGVPGLNRVKVQPEGANCDLIIKQSEIERLLSRQEMDDVPLPDSAVGCTQYSRLYRDKSWDAGTSKRKKAVVVNVNPARVTLQLSN